ncbi:tyrosine-protein phosphatase [Mycobacterium sp. CBMA271]|uniref:tyrosine-protein phosphatase n=1 Tax=unclassified Mycobacteroides TaxID=2618759 RepID=UPI00132748DC|nr:MULTISPECIES: tyrosine-protein phosphatase [unclassified Mycobacteroides]MUM19180.1 phosphotyrosine protein phosphatase [Mycobacteroides sp. CBMA 326]MUM21594.1 tyrosine-protein phosphatase [Mycobacteroides sp. CBMA 271]
MTISSAESTASPADSTVEGIWNFRDVGGPDSPVSIRPGVLFRSSELSGLTAAGAQTLREFGVTDLYDLRSPSEIARTGSDRVDGGIRVHEVPFATPVAGEERAPHEIAYRQMMIESMTSGRGPDPASQVEFMLSEYRRFVELPGTLVALKAVADQLASGATALVHCAAGKDRTGLLIGVVLHSVGIDYTDIAADYLLSNAAISAMRAHISAQMNAAEPELAQTMAAMLSDEVLGVREEYLDTGFSRVANVFGSSEAMLTAAGIDGDGLTALRSALI